MRLIDADALWNALNDAGGTGAERGGWADGWCKAIDAAIRMLEKAPTVEPEPQWIPVTERLPYENQPVCILLENGNVFRAEIRIRELLKEWWYRYDPTDEDMDMLGIHYEVEGWLKENPIVAWMPLSEPYTSDGEEENT